MPNAISQMQYAFSVARKTSHEGRYSAIDARAGTITLYMYRSIQRYSARYGDDRNFLRKMTIDLLALFPLVALLSDGETKLSFDSEF